jgi:hypothetical protein
MECLIVLRELEGKEESGSGQLWKFQEINQACILD